ncbi:MAG: ATP-binding protein [Gemmatimonadales bacterium]|nr:ATP-binding protein [Gemmatimonadales bacterium]
MRFRTRLALAFVVVALGPVLVLGVGLRREMLARFDRQVDDRVAGLVRLLRQRVGDDRAVARSRLASLARSLEADNRFRLAEAGGDRRWLLDWAAEAMPATGLAVLQLHDATGRILSSGQFRNDFDRVAPTLPTAVGSDSGLALVRARRPEGSVLALATMDSVLVAGRRYVLVGGLPVDSARLGALAPDPEIAVALELGPVAAGSAAVAEIPLRFGDDVGESVGRASLVVRRDTGPAQALARRLDRWIVVAVAGTLVAALLLALWLARRVAQPIADLAAKTERLDLERLDQGFATDRPDELGALSRLLDQMTNRLRLGAQRLREAERRATVGDLARQVNHDIKNGLTPIRHVVRHLVETAEREPERLAPILLERRATLESSVDYLDQLARSYARLAPSPTGARADAAAILHEIAAARRSERVAVPVRIEGPVPLVAADPLILRRIVENLVANAVDALEGRAGTIVLEAASAPAGPVRIKVADDGRGMTAAELERAFDDFFSTKPGGTGLGLSVVRRLVSDVGGSIRVETGPGQGATFFLELPAA